MESTGRETLKDLHDVQFADIPNWQNEEQRYNVTDTERGFWVSTGDGSGKDTLKVLSFDSSRRIDLKNGTEGRLWLTLNGSGTKKLCKTVRTGSGLSTQSEVYRWKSVVNLTDPFVLNNARIKMLQAAVK